MTQIILQAPRDVVSPRPGKRHGTPAPLRPGQPGFNEALQEVVDCVARTEKGAWSPELLARNNPTGLEGSVPYLLKKRLRLGSETVPKPKALALAVSMDKPWHLGEWLIDILLDMGAKWRVDRPGTVQFCDKDSSYTQTMQELNRRTALALDTVFDVKYYWKQPRPEDYKAIPGNVFTVDNHGAPFHWSYGAGHGAAAGATASVIIENLQLEGDVTEEVEHACWCFAHGRTLLGVHFHEDNEVGYKLGRNIK